MARVGLFGFANSGKTTLFNALTGLTAATAPHPFTTSSPNVGVGRVADSRLQEAAVLEGSAKVTHPSLELVDLPALGGGGEAMSRLREADALTAVVQAHSLRWDSGAPPDPAAEAEELLLELCLADHEVFRRRAPRLAKEATANPELKPAARAVEEAAALLSDGVLLRNREWNESGMKAFRDMSPVTLTPCVWVVNVDENSASAERDGLRSRVEAAVPEGDVVVILSARLEEEVARLGAEEREELYEGLGLGAGAPDAIMSAVYRALGLITFYTLGPKESRAWALPAGSSALQAAAKVHSDLARGFIRAEVCALDDVLGAGGWDAAKAAGLLRVEGKTYRVADGDALMIRFSV